MQCNDCREQKFEGIQNLGLSSRSIDTSQRPQKQKTEYAYFTDSDEKLEKDKQRWRKIQSTKTNIQKPIEVEVLDKKSLFKSEKGLKVTVENERYDLKQFVAQNARISSLISEIQLWQLISSVSDALFELQTMEIEHGNICNETILMDYEGEWKVSIPNCEHVSVRRLSERLREDFRYLVYNRKEDEGATQLQKDMYSLGMTLLDSISEFSEKERKSFLVDTQIAAKLRFAEKYYSQELIDLLTMMVGVGRARLPESEEVKRLINEERDN